jgi:hypothetical protein
MTVSTKKFFPITSVSKEDIIHAFQNTDIAERVKEMVSKMDEGEMKELASEMADDYCDQMFWDSLRIIFEERFLKKLGE